MDNLFIYNRYIHSNLLLNLTLEQFSATLAGTSQVIKSMLLLLLLFFTNIHTNLLKSKYCFSLVISPFIYLMDAATVFKVL